MGAVSDYIDFSNENLSFGVITVCAICLLMLLANTLRRKIPFLRRSLMPTCVIAGIIALVIKEIVLATTKVNIFSTATLEGLVFHCLSIGFIALCLRDKDDYAKEIDKTDLKRERVSAAKSGSLIVSTYLLQGLIGIAITVLLAVTFMPALNKAVGLILPLGFGQGPNQASNTGGIWDAAGIFASFGEAGVGRNFGITIAAFGFLWAAIAGVVIINRIAKKRGVKFKRDDYPMSGQTLNQVIEEPNEVPLSESIDKFTLQICMVGAVYLLTIGVVVLLEVIFRATGVKFLIDLIPTVWGFSFMIAVALALAAKAIMRRFVKKGIMKRKYPNSYMMNRISGAAFDISIAAALALISVMALGMLWIPVILLSAAGGLGSIFYLRFMCNRIYKGYKDEAFVAMYGMLTGTISNGMILLREIDREFTTPAANDLVIGSTGAIILGFPLLLLIAQAPNGNNIWWVAGIIVVYMAVLILFQLGYFGKWFKRGKKSVTAAADENDGGGYALKSDTPQINPEETEAAVAENSDESAADIKE